MVPSDKALILGKTIKAVDFDGRGNDARLTILFTDYTLLIVDSRDYEGCLSGLAFRSAPPEPHGADVA